MKKQITILLSAIILMSMFSFPYAVFAKDDGNIKIGNVDTDFRYEYNCNTNELVIDGYGKLLPDFMRYYSSYGCDVGFTEEKSKAE